MKELFETFGITLGRRHSYRQKVMFINEFSQPLLDRGIKVELQQKSYLGRKVTNVQIGDLDNAETIIVAAYDTGSRMFIPGYRYYPVNASQNYTREVINTVIQLLIAAVMIGIIFLITRNFSSMNLFRKIVAVLADVILGFLIYSVVNGIPASFNYNRNSASDIVIYRLASENLKNKKVAYVLTDDSISSYRGYQQLNSWLGESAKKKSFIILDCLASGEQVYCFSKNQNKVYNRIDKEKGNVIKMKVMEDVSNTPMSILPNSVVIASGAMVNDEFVAENVRTNKDYKVDLERLEKIITILRKAA